MKGDHIYDYKYIVGEELSCLQEENNAYSDNVIKVISRKKEKEVIVGHVPEPLAKVLYTMMKKWTILSLNAKIDGEKRQAPEGTWVPGGGIKIPCTYLIFAAKINKHKIRKIIKKEEKKMK